MSGWDPHLYDPHPDEVLGRPSRTFLAEVVTVNADGTVDVQPLKSRAGKASVPVPSWYVPAKGDRVILADLDGLRQTPIVVAPFGPEDGSLRATGIRGQSGVRGGVSSGGAVAFGSGFTVNRASAGHYTVTYAAAFAATPAVALALVTTAQLADRIEAQSAAAFSVVTFNSSTGAATDSAFNFIAEEA